MKAKWFQMTLNKDTHRTQFALTLRKVKAPI